MTETRKVVIFTRASTRDAEGDVAQQEQLLRERLTAEGIDTAGAVVLRHVSGARNDRGRRRACDELLEMLEANQVAVLAVTDLTRLGRQTATVVLDLMIPYRVRLILRDGEVSLEQERRLSVLETMADELAHYVKWMRQTRTIPRQP